MSIANITIFKRRNQEKLVEKYKKGGGELEKEREILIDEIEKLLKTARIGKIRCAYILLLKML